MRVFFGLVPVSHIRSEAIAETLRAGSPGASEARSAIVFVAGSSSPRPRSRSSLQSGPGCWCGQVQDLASADAGFNRARLVTFSITLPPTRFDSVGRVRTYQALLEQLRAVPGVSSASAITSLPLDRQVIPNQTEIANSTAPRSRCPGSTISGSCLGPSKRWAFQSFRGVVASQRCGVDRVPSPSSTRRWRIRSGRIGIRLDSGFAQPAVGHGSG